MATKNKTTETSASVTEFIHSFVNKEEKKQDAFRLIELMQEWSGFEPKMWGPSIIGFGSFHYKYASGHEGDMPLLGFSPRKAALTLYVTAQGHDNQKLLDQLGNCKISKACIYVKKLTDINISVLEKLCKQSIDYVNEHHECACREK